MLVCVCACVCVGMCYFQKLKNAVKSAAFVSPSSSRSRSSVSHDEKIRGKRVSRKQTTEVNSKRKPSVCASGGTVEVDRTSEKVADSAPNSDKTPPKRRCRLSVSYDESADQSASSAESDEESSKHRYQQEPTTDPATTVTGDKVAKTTYKTTTTVRCVIVIIAKLTRLCNRQCLSGCSFVCLKQDYVKSFQVIFMKPYRIMDYFYRKNLLNFRGDLTQSGRMAAISRSCYNVFC